MTDFGNNNRKWHPRKWHPLDEDLLDDIDDLFGEILPESEYGRLAFDIADYWIERLEQTWANKPPRIKERDLAYEPDDPLSRIFPCTVVIAYPDSVFRENEASLVSLERFLDDYVPSAKGLHILPACRIAENRFNDGYFSQIERNAIHDRFGTNETFSRLAEKYFSMADFVLNHVDIQNPNFQAFLEGDEDAGRCFYVYSEAQYQKLKDAGAFDDIFRPRPFPLFTIFRRCPVDDIFDQMTFEQRCAAVSDILAPDFIDPAIIRIFTIFEKMKNDQMLLDHDYGHITAFREYLKKNDIDPDTLFCLSQTQESAHPPYIFKKGIDTRADLLSAAGYGPDTAKRIARRYETYDHAVFGEQVRAMTTFSHVQVDVNTSTLEGLKMLADDFSWYLGLDLNMLRLDAANYAFKKFHTTCFGLPEVRKLMKILYLSMECVAPRIVANLEINDRLGVVLSQMADKEAPPPMIYDFHLPCMLPVIFNTNNTGIIKRAFDFIRRFDIPKQSIRFSIAESHDGKSVRGSMDLLTFSERWMLAEIVTQNNGRIKYKTVPAGKCSASEFREICRETGIQYTNAVNRLFRRSPAAATDELILDQGIKTTAHLFRALGIKPDAPGQYGALRFFADKVLNGREPYELCCSTIDSMVRIGDEKMEARRFLGFYTLAFALMGRNVKSIYFNDLPGLPNDLERMAKTGEYRDIKRTRSRFSDLAEKITGNDGLHPTIASGIASLIAIVDNDIALHPRGNEAEPIFSGNPAVAVIHNHYKNHRSLAIVNTANEKQTIAADISATGTKPDSRWTDRFTRHSYPLDGQFLSIDLSPYSYHWLKPEEMVK